MFRFFKGIVRRYRISSCASKIENCCRNSPNDMMNGEPLAELCKKPGNIEAIFSLAQDGYIELFMPDGASLPLYIMRTGKLYYYPVLRSEIWQERIFGFVAGVLTTLIASYLLQFITK